MTLSRRLFLGGLLAATSAPAIVKASSLMRVTPLHDGLVLPHQFNWVHAGTVTGRMTSSEPVWQEFKRTSEYLDDYRRDLAKRITFAERYGTSDPYMLGRRTGKPMLTMDYTELELRMIVQRNERDLFNALKSVD